MHLEPCLTVDLAVWHHPCCCCMALQSSHVFTSQTKNAAVCLLSLIWLQAWKVTAYHTLPQGRMLCIYLVEFGRYFLCYCAWHGAIAVMGAQCLPALSSRCHIQLEGHPTGKKSEVTSQQAAHLSENQKSTLFHLLPSIESQSMLKYH